MFEPNAPAIGQAFSSLVVRRVGSLARRVTLLAGLFVVGCGDPGLAGDALDIEEPTASRVVNGIKIWNRTYCCSERLSHYNILAWDSRLGTWNVISNHSADDTSGVGFFNHAINMVRTGYVMIAKTDDNYLHLAEVQVIGF